MARILKRPMFRRGGMPSNQGVAAIRPQYMGGGMTGIMSGIIPRPDAGLTPRVGYQEGTPEGYGFKNFAESPIGEGLMYGIPGAVADTFYTPINQIGRLFGANPGLSARKDIRAQKDKFFGEDREGRMTDEEVQKTNFFGIPFSAKSLKEKQQEVIDKEKKKIEKSNKIDDGTGTGTGTGTGAGQSDLESLQDYMKMFEAAAAGDPDEARKSKYLELAKFGANLIAQPGGDLTGAVGKAASSSIGSLSKQMAEERAAKRQGKLMGLKAGLDKTDMGEFGKKIKALAKLSGQSEESVAKKFLSGDSDFDKIYLAAAEQAGVEAGEAQKIYLKNIKIMSDKNPSIAAKLNKPFPKKNPVEGEYYVLPGGEFTRYVKGEKLKPSDPGFYDKEA